MTLAVGGAGATGLLVPWCSANDCCEEGSCVPRKPPKTPNNTSATHDEMSNLQARRALYGRPCPNHDLSRLCVVRDARGSAVAAFTWVLWKGRNRLKKIGSYQSKFFGPNFVPNVLKKIGERLRAGSEFFATSDFFGKNLIRPLLVVLGLRQGFNGQKKPQKIKSQNQD